MTYFQFFKLSNKDTMLSFDIFYYRESIVEIRSQFIANEKLINKMKLFFKKNILPSLFILTACTTVQGNDLLLRKVLENYCNIALANYWDAWDAANIMDQAIDDFSKSPSEKRLKLLRSSWLAARIPYGQSEVFRFYEGPIDREPNGPEGLLNAWPMDESYIDGVKGNPKAGIIQNPQKFPNVTADLILKLNQKDGETNVSCGYHAIEFLLWGQDLQQGSSGNRKLSDFTTDKFAERRLKYLSACSKLITLQLHELVEQWKPGKENYRKQFLTENPKKSLQKVLMGMGMLSGFELSGERMLVAYETRAQEDEHSCFSDNTHNDIIYNAKGIQNVYHGKYVHSRSKKVTNGPGIKELARELSLEKEKSLSADIRKAFLSTCAIPAPFDMAVNETNGRIFIKDAIDSLVALATNLKSFAESLDININISE